MTLPARRAGELTRWIVEQRPRRVAVDPGRVVNAFLEHEPDASRMPVPVATLFLANRECPFRCLMCDLWKHTLTETVAVGAIPSQVRSALQDLPPARWVKLYNSGSYFDPRAVPTEDDPAVAEICRAYERVIVECHPAFLGARALAFRDLLGAARLEIAVGLETADPVALSRLNKGMTLEDFRRAAAFIRDNDMSLRVFILVRPPGHDEKLALTWARRSLDFAFDVGAEVCCLIPTRAGNGAMEALRTRGEWDSPAPATLLAALEYGLLLRRGRVFADLWDLSDPEGEYLDTLRRLNREQSVDGA